ncbi:hypothetical protein Acr_12g0000090 [Actinidia rufa]|uniref:Transposase (putative) gypsy type domain-containing protein n=1 Tax=Actinidia rufa TaxID=165716 RepID=A0A7J0FFK9_9ERIC|nr:hypothetical protein Acr_12g0000090 [Actinidia rufa]
MERDLGDVGDMIGKIAIWRVSRQVLYLPKGEEEIALWLWASSYEYSDGGSGELSRDSLARFNGSSYLGQEGSEIALGILMWRWNFIGLVWRCPLSSLGRGNPLDGAHVAGAVIDVLGARNVPTSPPLKLSDLAKVVAQKAATSASKGIVISEGSETTSGKRALDDGSKGKQVAQLPESKKAKIDTGTSEAPARPPIASGGGSSVRQTLGENLGPQALVMASAATAEKILARVILPADKEKVDRLTFDQVVTKFLHVLGQGVILGSSLAVRSRDFAEGALNQKAVAESAEMEMVRAQNWVIELEGALAKEKVKGKKLAEDADARDKVIARLEARISELEKKPVSHARQDRRRVQRVGRLFRSGEGVGILLFRRRLRLLQEATRAPAELDNLGATYSFPPGVRLRIPRDGETILSARQGEVAFYEAAFLAGLRLPIHPTIREILIHYKICPAQLSPNSWRSVICSLARPEKNLFRGSLSNVKGWKKRFFFASGDEWEFLPSMATDDRTPRVPRSRGTPGKSCNKLPALSEVDAKRTETVFGKIEPGGYFEVSKVLGSRTFKKHFALGCTVPSSSGGDNTTSGDDGEFGTRENSVEYLGVIGRNIGEAIRRALPGIPDKTLLRWLGGKVKDSFMDLLSGKSGSGSDSGSDSISDSELPPELRSDAMSARAGAPILGEKTGGKAKDEKAVKAATAKPPTKGVIIKEKRTREGNHISEKGEPDSSKGKGAAPPPPSKRFKSIQGAINARGRTAEAGTSSPGGGIGSESMMSDAFVARRLLTRVIPTSDKKEVDQLSENDLVAKSFHALGQVVVFASSLALRSQEHLHDIDFHMARADSAKLELVKAQKRAVKAENRLAELSEEGSKPGTEVDDLKATVAELTNKLAKAKELAIEDFKTSGEFKAAVTDSAATYFSEGFEFCKRQLLHQFPNLGVDVAKYGDGPRFRRGRRGDERRRRSCCRTCS